MSYLYAWKSLPNQVDIICPNCGGHAIFEIGLVRHLQHKQEVAYFQKSPIFDYEARMNSGQKQHYVIGYPNLLGGYNETDLNLPDGYDIRSWLHPEIRGYSRHQDLGSYTCSQCLARKKYRLCLKDDAYYKTEIKQQVLWALNRDSLIDLKHYIASNKRDAFAHQQASFLLHIPTVFKTRKSRKLVIAQIDKLLADKR
ncbi:hypothetical protein PSAR109036_10860 [Psychrobacter arenosus]|uniref:hypothetical protein n=1 Tax=Psychrobacter arenosus TaxID=256326 RepID=UPI00191A2673|nr:hypothetical protein [Psychrobacter arenosus]